MKTGLKMKIGIGSAVFLLVAGFVSFPPSFLRVQEVQVLNPTTRISEFDLLRLSGVKKGDNLLTLRLSAVRSRLLRFPWIHEVQLSKRFPGRLLIGVEEEIPAALLELESRYLVSGEGRIFKKMEAGDPGDLPVITGLGPKDLGVSLRPVLDLLLTFEKTDPLGRVGVSEIHCGPKGQVSLMTREPRVRVEMGADGWNEKTDRLAKFWEQIRETSKKPKGIDLQFEKKIIVKQGGDFDG